MSGLLHVRRTGILQLAAGPERTFDLFTARGEGLWMPAWQPWFVHPAEPSDAVGTVFTTEHGGEHTVWTVAECDRERFVIRYVRMTPGSRLAWVIVEGKAAGRGTEVRVTYDITALTEGGNAAVAHFTAEHFAGEMATWERMINGYLARG